MNADWSIAVFTSREDAATLQRTLEAVVIASAAHRCTIDILVDSNPEAAAAIARWDPEPPLPSQSTMRLWLVTWGDKACTWNRYLHEIAPQSSTAFFIDGYVRPLKASLEALASALAARPEAWAASGVPTVGPSATSQRHQLLADGGLHGNLYALRGDVVHLFRQKDFRLPLALYRNDSLIGAVVYFSADPQAHRWNAERIAVVAGATWDNDVLPLFGIARIRAYVRRRVRQAQGDLENAAIRQHLAVERLPPECLPRTTAALVRDRPIEAISKRGPVDRYLMKRATARLRSDRVETRCNRPPRLLRVWSGV